jgi:hypothetical protein
MRLRMVFRTPTETMGVIQPRCGGLEPSKSKQADKHSYSPPCQVQVNVTSARRAAGNSCRLVGRGTATGKQQGSRDRR